MQKTSAKIITALLLAALSLTLVPLAFASTGNILINDTTPPQDLPITPVPAGGNISLYFGSVTFSGSQFYLLLSQDGLSQVSSGDIQYTPLFNVAAVGSSTVSQVAGTTSFPGGWTIGDGWINGSIPLNIAGGTYFIKAFDGFTTALAVTQGFTVSASLRIIPATGSAGTSIIVSGNAFPANALVNLSYVNPVTLAIVRFANFTQSNSLGQFNYSMPAPDLMQVPAAGDQTPATNTITFSATSDGTTIYTATYTEGQRGLVQFGRPRASSTITGNLQNATGVYGNLTNFVSTVSVGVGQNVRIVGNNFFPGTLLIKWDNTVDVTPSGAAANQTGWFNTTIVVPATGLGTHNITITDAGVQTFIVFLNVVQSITISPTSGPIGTTVTVNGFGFPANGVPTGNVYNVTITVGSSTTVRAAVLTDANGQFTTTFAIPTGTAGGSNTITATANDTSLTAASATFTVTANFFITVTNTVYPASVPTTTSFYANSSETSVAVSGTGFPASTAYFVAIDNIFSPFTNTTNGVMTSTSGVLSFSFIGVGFQPGLHVVAIYTAGSGSGSNAPAAKANFTVLLETAGTSNTTTTADLLNSINSTVTQNAAALTKVNTTVNTINTNLLAINATVIAINGNVVTLSTAIGQMNTTLSAINANIISINGTVATIRTNVGTVQTSINSLNATLVSINNGFATVQSTVSGMSNTLNSISSAVSGIASISTNVGSIQSSLSDINAKITSIQTSVGGIATIQTDLGTLQGTVTAIQGDVATIKTNVGTIQADVSGLQTDVSNVPGQVNVPIWIAVVLALIAAIAAIASLLLVRRKIAG